MIVSEKQMASLVDAFKSTRNIRILEQYCVKRFTKDYSHMNDAVLAAVRSLLPEQIERTAAEVRLWTLTPENVAEANVMAFRRLKPDVDALMRGTTIDMESTLEQRLMSDDTRVLDMMDTRLNADDFALPDRDLNVLHERYMAAWRTPAEEVQRDNINRNA